MEKFNQQLNNQFNNEEITNPEDVRPLESEQELAQGGNFNTEYTIDEEQKPKHTLRKVVIGGIAATVLVSGIAVFNHEDNKPTKYVEQTEDDVNEIIEEQKKIDEKENAKYQQELAKGDGLDIEQMCAGMDTTPDSLDYVLEVNPNAISTSIANWLTANDFASVQIMTTKENPDDDTQTVSAIAHADVTADHDNGSTIDVCFNDDKFRVTLTDSNSTFFDEEMDYVPSLTEVREISDEYYDR
ncbi:MAG: hypothetical protein Q4C83_00080 [Candidatus Saccharibacteria bacterium]|nr:hypothetical protein [Candidatus Saccharibacteria bacterium]